MPSPTLPIEYPDHHTPRGSSTSEDDSARKRPKARTQTTQSPYGGTGCWMGLLDQLWDETVAGPRPDSGLGKLRKYSSFSPSSSSSAPAANDAPPPPQDVTRSITIARPPALTVDGSPRSESYSSSVPDSPASTPGSPFASATTPKCEGWRKVRRKPQATVGPRSPTVYDWVVISSLDR